MVNTANTSLMILSVLERGLQITTFSSRTDNQKLGAATPILRGCSLVIESSKVNHSLFGKKYLFITFQSILLQAMHFCIREKHP